MGQKPIPKTLSVIDYNKAASFIEQKLGYPLRDTLHSHEHFGKWCKSIGIVPDGSSQDQYRQYRQSPDGEAACPAYRDFWHFLCDHCDPKNGGTICISSDLLHVADPWQGEIVIAFIEEFGDDCEYLTEW